MSAYEINVILLYLYQVEDCCKEREYANCAISARSNQKQNEIRVGKISKNSEQLFFTRGGNRKITKSFDVISEIGANHAYLCAVKAAKNSRISSQMK